MARNYIADGEHFNYTAPGAVASGDVVLMGATVGVSLNALTTGQVGPVKVNGVFSVPKLGTDTMAQGALLYWDNTNKRMTTTASGNTLAGRAYVAAGSGATTVQALLNV